MTAEEAGRKVRYEAFGMTAADLLRRGIAAQDHCHCRRAECERSGRDNPVPYSPGNGHRRTGRHR